MIIPLDSVASEQPAELTLQSVGGKGLNLGRLVVAAREQPAASGQPAASEQPASSGQPAAGARAGSGFSVPPGFIIAAEAYRQFVQLNRLQPVIQAALAGCADSQPQALEQAARQIRAAFAAASFPAQLRLSLLTAYRALGGAETPAPVAVRSSATAEDLPDLSFAGQQDTFLNVVGEEALLRAVVDCWSSLWTARAIGYRQRNQLGHDGLALAVIVQVMVESEVSGVLFTANPLTGARTEIAIDATLGLGEALVSGKVEPDHYLVEAQTGRVLQQRLGAKALAARSQPGGGVAYREEPNGDRPALTAAQIQQLCALGQQIQAFFGAPQDIEWALAKGRFYLLQSRPITSLFPVPEQVFDPLIVWFSFNAVQGLAGPMTPLGLDTARRVAAGASAMFGVPPDVENFKVFAEAGERLWVRISDVIRHPWGKRIFRFLLGFIEPGVGQILAELEVEPALGAGQGRIKFSTLRRLGHFVRSFLPAMVRTLLRPEAGRADFEAAIERRLEENRLAPGQDLYERTGQVVRFIEERVSTVFSYLLPRFVTIFAPAMASLNLLLHLAGERRELVLAITRGLRDNVTTQMDLALWATAQAIAADARASRYFQQTEPQVLASDYLRGQLPGGAQAAPAAAAVAEFLQRYGMRGVAEIDLGRPRWREDPTPVMRTLQSYLRIPPEKAPDVQFQRGVQAAEDAVEQLVQLVRRQPGGRLKEKLVRGAARRIRVLMGARESPKFFAIRTMGVARQALLEVGQELVQAGALERAEDVFFLRLADLKALAQQEQRDWRALVAERRQAYAREQRRRQEPRVLVSDGRAFYEAPGARPAVEGQPEDGVLVGSPVSPGVVEGVVRVVLDPHQTPLAPGEILVCPGTDPAWTPLFLAAGGLVMEVGGMMTHGSVVAREYGLPAVAGVPQATRRLHDGQRIRVNGTTGEIVILPSPAASR